MLRQASHDLDREFAVASLALVPAGRVRLIGAKGWLWPFFTALAHSVATAGPATLDRLVGKPHGQAAPAAWMKRHTPTSW